MGMYNTDIIKCQSFKAVMSDSAIEICFPLCKVSVTFHILSFSRRMYFV